MKPDKPAAETPRGIREVTRDGGAAGDAAQPGYARERSGSKGHGSQFGRKKQEAIAALVSQRTVEEAARVAGLSAQTLYRWMKIPAFEAAYSEARQALFRQALGRLQQASGTAVTVLLKVMYDAGAPASDRLRAADRVLSHTRFASRIGEVGARLRVVKRARAVSRLDRRGDAGGAEPAQERGSARSAGHGAKFGRRKEEAIVALLKQRNVEDAARVAGVGTTTLYRWMKDPVFAGAYREARLAAYGQAGARLEQASGPAATTILRIMVDPGAPAGAKVRAAVLALEHARKASEEDIEGCLAELKGGRQAAPTVLPGGKRSFAENARERPRAA